MNSALFGVVLGLNLSYLILSLCPVLAPILETVLEQSNVLSRIRIQLSLSFTQLWPEETNLLVLSWEPARDLLAFSKSLAIQ